jgi:hypothetical protein
MGPHRRKLILKALFEIRGVLVGVSAERLLRASDDELLVLISSIEKSIESAQTTDPLPPPPEG